MSRRRPKNNSNSSDKQRQEEVTPHKIWAYINDLYRCRQLEWDVELRGEGSPDWERLLGLHLQMRELEHLTAGIEELGP